MSVPYPELEFVRTAAGSWPEAHRELGRGLGSAIRTVLAKRLGSEEPHDLEDGLEQAGENLLFLARRARAGEVPLAVRRGLHEYLACLEAWAEGAELAQFAEDLLGFGCPHAPQAALWLQDDNTGCVTGSLRRDDGRLLVWHTEEDTIGLFDRPRCWEATVGGETRSAFLYPYLLPGPAFGWNARQIHAVDSLHIARTSEPGCPTAVAAWLLWRLGPELGLLDLVPHLGPYVDGAALHQFSLDPAGGPPLRRVVEIGGEAAASRVDEAPLSAQANCFLTPGPGRKLEALTAAERRPYEARLARLAELVAATSATHAPTPDDVLAWLADDAVGGEYALSNADVKAHLAAELSTHEVRIHVVPGPGRPGVRFAPLQADVDFTPQHDGMRLAPRQNGLRLAPWQVGS